MMMVVVGGGLGKVGRGAGGYGGLLEEGQRPAELRGT